MGGRAEQTSKGRLSQLRDCVDRGKIHLSEVRKR